jgi:tetratricopeptide (TPR) repeat protein
MIKPGFLFLLPMMLALTCVWASAQTPSPTNAAPAAPAPPPPKPHVVDVPQPDQPSAPPSASPEDLDSAKVAEYQKRFQQGYALEQAGQLKQARDIYDGILAEQPKAKRSLLEAGRISYELGDLPKADAYLSRLHDIVPDFPDATELLIQINQTLKKDVKVELLVRDFCELHASNKEPEFTKSPLFVRERIPLGSDEIIVSQFFDYRQDPDTVWMAEVFGTDGQLKRRLLLNYDDAATQALRAKDTKYATTEVFTWFEHIIKDQRVKEIDAYLQIFALPDYQKFRSAMLIILANPPKPIYSAPVDVPVQSQPQ